MYQIPIEGKQIKRNQVTGMHLMAGLLLIVIGLFTWAIPNSIKQENFNFLNWAGLIYALLGLVIIVTCIFFNKKIIQTKANFKLRIFETVSLATILGYALLKKWYLPAGYSAAALIGILLALYWEKIGKQSKLAQFNENGMYMAGIGKIDWSEIKNVLLRHNILTIDCRNNKLYQLTIDNRVPNTINAEEFENYCAQLINTKKQLQQSDW